MGDRLAASSGVIAYSSCNAADVHNVQLMCRCVSEWVRADHVPDKKVAADACIDGWLSALLTAPLAVAPATSTGECQYKLLRPLQTATTMLGRVGERLAAAASTLK